MKVFLIGRLPEDYLDFYLTSPPGTPILDGFAFASWIKGFQHVLGVDRVDYFFFTDTGSQGIYEHGYPIIRKRPHSGSRFLQRFSRTFHRRQNRECRNRIKSFRPDIIVTYPLEKMDADILDAQRVVGWIGNDPSGFSPHRRAQIGKYSLAISSVPLLLERAIACGAAAAEPLMQTADGEFFGGASGPALPSCDIVFAGQWFAGREEDLDAMAEFNLRIYGLGWQAFKDFYRLKPRYHGPAWTWKLRSAYKSAKLGFNSIWQDFEIPGGNTRTHELAACGVPQLAKYSGELARCYPDGKAAVYYNSRQELIEKVRHYLARPDELENMGRTARELFEQNHDCRVRMAELLEIIKGL